MQRVRRGRAAWGRRVPGRAGQESQRDPGSSLSGSRPVMRLLAQTAAPFWDLKLVGGGVSGAADGAGPHGRPAHRRRGSRPESQGEAEPSGARGRPGGVDLSPSSLSPWCLKGPIPTRT